MTKVLTVTAVGIVATLYAMAGPEIKGTSEELASYLRSVPGQVSLIGEAELQVETDTAEIVLRVKNSDKSLKSALVQNQQIRTDIVALMEKGGISTNSVHVSRFTTTQNQGFFTSKARSYDVESRVTIEAKSEKDVQAIASLIDDKDTVSLVSMTFKDTQKDKHGYEVLVQALTKVKNLKATYEKELGVTLTPRNMSPQALAPDAGRFPQTRMYADRRVDDIETLHKLTSNAVYAGLPVSQFDSVVYRTRVEVTYDVTGDEKK